MKQIAKTGKVLDRLKASVGPDADVENLAVFEAVALNQLPLRKKQPLYNGAVASLSMLKGMADKVNAESLPLEVGHLASGTPNGRVFHGEVVQGEAGSELRTLFFVSDAAGELVANLDNGTIDQVSIGAIPQQILCSSCGWDYRSPDATFGNLYEGVCANDHVLGENGVHAELIGVEEWYELSLVGRGGAQGARVAGPSNAVLAALAASGAGDPHALCLHASPTPPPEKPVPAPNAEGADALLQLTDKLVAASVEVSTLKAENVALKARVAELEAREPEKVEPPEAAVLAAAVSAAEAANAALMELATEARTQAGLGLTALPTDPAALAADIKRFAVQGGRDRRGLRQASRPAAAPAALAPRSNAAFLTPKH
jgi:hypothetical protein